MNCCTEYTDLGCFDSCDTIILPYQATETGLHTIIIKHNDYYKSYTVSFTIGDYFEIDLSKFNENGEGIFQIQMPSGDFFSTVIEEIEYFCFKVDLFVRNQAPQTITIPPIIESNFLLQDDLFSLVQADGSHILIL